MDDNRPIGIFDSGMGGLSVWQEVRKMLPWESIIYYGDGKNCPYGNLMVDKIREYSDAAFGFFAEGNVKLAVVACNTATAAAIEFLRRKYPFPIVGMEPAVKPAALSTNTGKVGVLATEASFKGDLYNRTSSLYAGRADIIPVIGEGFVELVEAGLEDTPQALETVRRCVGPLLEAGVDKIVLGCTHYPFLKEALRIATAGKGVEIIDPSPAVAKRVKAIIYGSGIASSDENLPVYEFFSPAGREYIRRLRKRAGVEV